MSLIEFLSKIDSLARPLLFGISPALTSKIYSTGRKEFLKYLTSQVPENIFIPSQGSSIKLWDIKFGCRLFNSAGMFKSGEGYELCRRQGAGAFLAGTTTSKPRKGNRKNGILHPFMPFPKSNAALNWMGLPNEGHSVVAYRLANIKKVDGCPVGASVSIDPDLNSNEGLPLLIKGLKKYQIADVNFIELNESCPNVEHDHSTELINGIDKSLVERLEYIKTNFLDKRSKRLPIVVKFSVDTQLELVPNIIDILIDLGFDGVNFGNTVKEYDLFTNLLSPSELKGFEYFTQTFGGGLSGKPLKNKSLELSKNAVLYKNKKNLTKEFIIIRTGGIENSIDLQNSINDGIDLNQWFTGYFEMFSKYGHSLYEQLLITNY
jgi:dihydroorotate dehydrogenase